MHNAIFSGSDLKVIMLGKNEVQTQIANFLGQKLITVMPSERSADGKEVMIYHPKDLMTAIDAS